MSEKVHTISAGSSPVYEIVERDDDVVFRLAESPATEFRIMRSAVSTLIGILKRIEAGTATQR